MGSNKSEQKISSNREKNLDSKVSAAPGKSTSNKEQQPEIIRIHSSVKNDSIKQRKFSADREEVRVNVKEKLANFRSNETTSITPSVVKSGKVSGLASTFVQQQEQQQSESKDTSQSNNKIRDGKSLPKPAPRSATVSLSDRQHSSVESAKSTSNSSNTSKATSSFGTSSSFGFSNTNNSSTISSSSTSTIIGPTSSSSGSASTSAKRINNPRQNHGRAVAPPQLPPTSGSASSNDHAKITASSEQLSSYNDLNKQLSITKSVDDDSFDPNQSPIAQRLLQYSKDYKGR